MELTSETGRVGISDAFAGFLTSCLASAPSIVQQVPRPSRECSDADARVYTRAVLL